ncbi:acyltransferase family protein [Ottowia thiooxydans]|uniref:acyltransferase family protein n=1 Tax=Ottowia thiooxydans TaxID=219182 RepID=UPI0003FB26D5|nr:acyltransferase family protein [Ottowia thiooxydans]
MSSLPDIQARPDSSYPAPSFRPDIEGLRAIAVLLVIGAHFAIPGMSAGFIGVDIFFVISGYLITSILVHEQESTGKIALARFYANRLRRLFPALATMLVVSSALACKLLPEAQNLAHSEAAAMATLWVSNIYFAFADVDYFASETSSNAFLHTWSLGVEEQFYLVWPLLILVAARLAKGANLRGQVRLFTGVAIVSLAASLMASYTYPVLGFYMMPTRAWQFAAGALVWMLSRQQASRPPQTTLLSWSGAALLFAALVVIKPDTAYPGLLALLPTLGASALLLAGTGQTTQTGPRTALPGAFLALPPMQAIGRISYAWYLWHWPILIIGEYLLPIKGDIRNTVLAIGVSLLAAILTHHLVENPVRYGRSARIQNKWQIALALFAMVILNSQLLRWNTHTEKLLASTKNDVYAKAAADIPVIYQHNCDDWYQSAELKPCVYGKNDAPKTAVLLGDSIGAQWFPTLTEMHDPEQWKIIVLTKSSCPMVDEPFFYQRIGREYTECSEWRHKAVEWMQSQKVDRLFVGSAASNGFTDKQWTDGTRRFLKSLAPATKAIYLIEANPRLGFHGPSCLSKYQPQAIDEHACQGTSNDTAYAHVATLLKAVTDEPALKTFWIGTSNFVCPGGRCQAIQGKVVVFRDSQHLTGSFAASAAPYFLQQVQQYERSSQ